VELLQRKLDKQNIDVNSAPHVAETTTKRLTFAFHQLQMRCKVDGDCLMLQLQQAD
jgi:hypothetical protein